MNTSDALTDFVDQLNVFPTLEAFNASSTSEALKWTDLVQDIVYQIVSTRTVNTHGQLIILSLQNADRSCLRMWNVDKRVTTKPYGNGELAICTTNRVEKDWKGAQFISTVLIICKLFMQYI